MRQDRIRKRNRNIALVALLIAVLAGAVIAGLRWERFGSQLITPETIATPIAFALGATPVHTQPARRIAAERTEVFYDGELFVSVLDADPGSVTAVVGSPGAQPDSELAGTAIGEKLIHDGRGAYEVLVTRTGDGWAEIVVSQLRVPARPLTVPPNAVQIDVGQTLSVSDNDLLISLNAINERASTLTLSSPGYNAVTYDAKRLGESIVYEGAAQFNVRVIFVGEQLAAFAVSQLPQE